MLWPSWQASTICKICLPIFLLQTHQFLGQDVHLQPNIAQPQPGTFTTRGCFYLTCPWSWSYSWLVYFLWLYTWDLNNSPVLLSRMIFKLNVDRNKSRLFCDNQPQADKWLCSTGVWSAVLLCIQVRKFEIGPFTALDHTIFEWGQKVYSHNESMYDLTSVN